MLQLAFKSLVLKYISMRGIGDFELERKPFGDLIGQKSYYGEQSHL